MSVLNTDPIRDLKVMMNIERNQYHSGINFLNIYEELLMTVVKSFKLKTIEDAKTILEEKAKKQVIGSDSPLPSQSPE